MSLDYGLPGDGAELDSLVESHAVTYLFPKEKTKDWLKDHTRVVRLNGEVGGGLRLLPFRQWFGGRSVEMGAVSAVGVRPDMRSKGLATFMLRSCLEEMRASGIHISGLFPATVRLYRWAGYEIAMAWQEWKVDSKRLPLGPRALPVNQTQDRAAIEESYTRWARRHNGVLDRTPSAWERVWRPGDAETDNPLAYMIGDGEGHIVLRQIKPSQGWGYHLNLSDLVAHTPEALHRAFTFLADHRSFAHDVYWSGPLSDERILPFEEQIAEAQRYFAVMLRIVDVAGALEARGWDEAVDTEFSFTVKDDVCEWNNASYRVRVRDGAATVDRVKGSDFTLDVRGLASIYSSWLSPDAVVAAGLAEGTPPRGMAATFAGPTPWMNDWF